MALDPEALKAVVRYQRDFIEILENVARNALSRDPILAGAEFASLYLPDEITSAIDAAQRAGLPANEGVACFIVWTAADRAEAQKRKGLFQRLRANFAPHPDTVEHRHLAMTNFAINELLNGQLDQGKGARFAKLYEQKLTATLMKDTGD